MPYGSAVPAATLPGSFVRCDLLPFAVLALLPTGQHFSTLGLCVSRTVGGLTPRFGTLLR